MKKYCAIHGNGNNLNASQYSRVTRICRAINKEEEAKVEKSNIKLKKEVEKVEKGSHKGRKRIV